MTNIILQYMLYYYYSLLCVIHFKLTDEMHVYESISIDIIKTFEKLFGKYYFTKYENILVNYFMELQTSFINLDYDCLDAAEIKKARIIMMGYLYNLFLEPIQIILFENIINDIFKQISDDTYLTEEQLINIINSYSNDKIYLKYKKSK